MNKLSVSLRGMRMFLTLWLTQAFSALGSSMTAFALVVWSYQAEGSALSTALLTVCSYAPYVAMSIFAGTLSDRWNKKKTLLICDALAALTTVGVLLLLKTGHLRLWHLYGINAINGLMNTVQQPASEVAVTLLTPREQVQRASSLQQVSNSIINIATPALAAAMIAFAGLESVLLFDLVTFAAAALSLLVLIRIPASPAQQKTERFSQALRTGLGYLGKNRGILMLILFLSGINLVASMHSAALPALAINRAGEAGYGMVNTVVGIATLAGSLLVAALPQPKSRVKVICNTLLFAMTTENFLLAFGRIVPVWCLGAALGWIFIPMMSANLGALMRERVPVELQGRVYSVRNALQFFTIPVGYLASGWLVDCVFEPLMAVQSAGSPLVSLFGTGKGAGAALTFGLLGVLGTLICLYFRRNRHIRALEG
ncbi:MAG: MFS transporter [Candidatus Spyradocola sp.]